MVAFEVRADGTPRRTAIAYEWTIDGSLAHVGPTGRFRFTAQPSANEVQVAVSARVGNRTIGQPVRWEVVASDPRRPTTTPPPPASANAAAGCISKDDALTWMSAYQQAWETKDFARLRALGVLGSKTQEDAVRDDIGRRQGYRVQLSNVSVTSDGCRCRVAFDRLDRYAGGSSTRRPREVYTVARVGGMVRATTTVR